MKWTTTTLALVLTIQAHAQSSMLWVPVSNGSNSDSVYVDIANLKASKSKIMVWVKTKYLTPIKRSWNKEATDSTLELHDIDLKSHLQKLISVIEYDEKGEIINSVDFPPEQQGAVNISPDSIGSEIENILQKFPTLLPPQNDNPKPIYHWEHSGKSLHVSSDVCSFPFGDFDKESGKEIVGVILRSNLYDQNHVLIGQNFNWVLIELNSKEFLSTASLDNFPLGVGTLNREPLVWKPIPTGSAIEAAYKKYSKPDQSGSPSN